jgi:O-antigen/teichoic acid export membrane protein
MSEVPAGRVAQGAWRKLRRLLRGEPAGEPSEKSPIGGTRFLRDSATTFLTSVLALGIGTIQAAVVARTLLPEGKGALTAALILPQLLAILTPLGLNWSATYHLGRRTFDRERLMRSVLTALLLLSGAAMILCVGIGFALRGLLLPGVPRSAFLLAVLLLPTQVFLIALGGLFRGEMRIIEANRMDLARSGLMFVGILVGIRVLGLGVLGVILGQLLAEILVVMMAFRRLRGIPARPLLNGEILGKLTGYGLKVYSFTILLYLNYRFDLFMVRTMLDLRQTGLYATAVSLAEILWMVPTSLGWVLFPSIARSSGAERDRLTLAVCRNAFWVMLVLCGALALGRNAVLRLFFGEQFLPASPALLAILPGILAMAIQLVLGSDLSGRGHPLPVTLAAALGLLANFLLNLLWIPRYGIVGASLASSVSYSIIALVVIVAFVRISGARVRDAFVLRREDWGRVAGVFSRMREAAA